MNMLLIIWLLLPGITYGAAQAMIEPSATDGEEQSVQLWRRSSDEAGARIMIPRTLYLGKKDPFAKIPQRQLRERAHTNNIPWIVCDFEAYKRGDILKFFKPKQGFFDPLVLLRKRQKDNRLIDLTSFVTLSATIKKEFDRNSNLRLSALSIYILDSEKAIGFPDEAATQSFICSQLKYSLCGDVEALKQMIMLYNQRKFIVKDFLTDRDVIGDAYIAAWRTIDLAADLAEQRVETAV